jgi:hypothetical protein
LYGSYDFTNGIIVSNIEIAKFSSDPEELLPPKEYAKWYDRHTNWYSNWELERDMKKYNL